MTLFIQTTSSAENGDDGDVDAVDDDKDDNDVVYGNYRPMPRRRF